jgi:hypothetical protein
MSQSRSGYLIAALLALGGAALYRVLDTDAIPFIGAALFVLALYAWTWRQAKRKTLSLAAVRLRPLTAAQRQAAVSAVKSDVLRAQIAVAVDEQGSETRDGSVERFPFPAVFRTRAAKKFWLSCALSSTALGLAAFATAWSSSWRGTCLVLGCLFAVRARQKSRLGVLSQSQIEISPYRLSFLGPTGTMQTVSFADGIRLDDKPEQAMLIVWSGETAIPISYYLIGVNRLVQLVRTYGNLRSETCSPAS